MRIVLLSCMSLDARNRSRPKLLARCPSAPATGWSIVPPMRVFDPGGFADNEGFYPPAKEHQTFPPPPEEGLHFAGRSSPYTSRRTPHVPAAKDEVGGEGFRPAKRSRIPRAIQQAKKRMRILGFDRGEKIHELLDRESILPVVQKRLHGNPRTAKHQRPTQNGGMRGDGAGVQGDHGVRIPDRVGLGKSRAREAGSRMGSLQRGNPSPLRPG